MTRALALLALAAAAFAQQPDPLAPLRPFEGHWESAASGVPGKGAGKREYRFEMNGRFLAARNRAVYEPKSPGAKPEIHEDFGMFSYDRSLKKIVLRQFHVEGFVNEYHLSSISDDGKSFEFTTVRIENIPPGWRAREAYRIVSATEIVETFSLAPPGKDFETYSETRLHRLVR